MNISVYDILESQNAVFHDDGLRVFSDIAPLLKDNDDEIEVSFQGIKVCTTQFLNASFGKLLLTFGEDVVKKRIHPVSYNGINAFSEKYELVWENFQKKNKQFIEEAYA
jgi:hypothetical protein